MIERLDPDRVTHVLEDAGFRIARVERYAMVYRHEPGKASRLLRLDRFSSRPGRGPGVQRGRRQIRQQVHRSGGAA